MMVIHIELCFFITLSVTLTLFQGHSSVKQFELNILCSCPIKLQLCRIAKYIKQAMNIPLFLTFCTYAKEIIVMFPDLTKTVVDFFMDAVQGRFFKLCIIITSLWVYQFTPCLMTLTLFQGHVCVRIITANYFVDSCPP